MTRRPRVTEKGIQTYVMDYWRACAMPNTLVAAIPNARAFGQPGLTRGLFDLLVIGGNVGVGFLELKTLAGSLSYPQEVFKQLLSANKIPHAVTHGLEQPIQVLEAWGIVRKQPFRAVA